MTDRANTPLYIGENIFKSIVWDSLVTAGMAAMFAAVPGLNVWPLGPIIRYVVRLFSEQLFNGLRLFVDVQTIAFVNIQHKAEFDREAVKLRIVASESGIDSEAFRKAREDAKASLAKFVGFGK